MITISVVCVWMVIVLFPFNFGFLTTNATQFQFDALSWVENNLPKNSIIVVDNFFIAELREDGFKYVQEGWFVNNASLNGNALNIDYFICSNLSVVDTPILMMLS